MSILRLILAIIGGVITLVREVRYLVNSINKGKPLPYFIRTNVPQIEEKVIDMEQVQIDMEKLFHKNQLHPRIRSEFQNADLPFRDVMVKNGLDPAFGKGITAYNRYLGDAKHPISHCVAPLDQGPWYAIKLLPGDLGTFAGIRTDECARALAADGTPVPGLYAVGNDALSARLQAFRAAQTAGIAERPV